MRASDERHQIAKNARDSFDGFWNRFPTFWSAQTDRRSLEKKSWICTGSRVHAHYLDTREQCLLEFISILTPQ